MNYTQQARIMNKEERKHTATNGGRWSKGRDDLDGKEQMEKKNGNPIGLAHTKGRSSDRKKRGKKWVLNAGKHACRNCLILQKRH